MHLSRQDQLHHLHSLVQNEDLEPLVENVEGKMLTVLKYKAFSSQPGSPPASYGVDAMQKLNLGNSPFPVPPAPTQGRLGTPKDIATTPQRPAWYLYGGGVRGSSLPCYLPDAQRTCQDKEEMAAATCSLAMQWGNKTSLPDPDLIFSHPCQRLPGRGGGWQ